MSMTLIKKSKNLIPHLDRKPNRKILTNLDQNALKKKVTILTTSWLIKTIELESSWE